MCDLAFVTDSVIANKEGVYVSISEDGYAYILKKWFDETIQMSFGKYEFRVPKAYDEVLRHTYGDYMQLPPEEDRIGHHYYKVYEK